MKLIHLLMILLTVLLGGCQNPLDESGAGKSTIDDAYNFLLRTPANFSFSSHEMQSGQVRLFWGASSRADSYEVRYGTSSGAYTTTAGCTSSPCLITGLTNGVTYYFTVTATNSVGSTEIQSELSVTPVDAPSIPTSVAATSSNGSVSLSWSASSGSGTIRYKVLRSSTSGGGYSEVATNLSSTNYNDTSVTNGSTYYYVVRSFNEFGEGTNSSEVIGTPMAPPGAPSGVTLTSGLSRIDLSWTASAGSGTKTYRVYRSTSSGSGFSQIATGLTTTIYADTGLSAGTTYYYYVIAHNLGGDSVQSSEVSGAAYQTLGFNVPFDAGTGSSYVFSDSGVSEFFTGLFRLTPTDQTDNDGTTFNLGTHLGTQYDSTNHYLRLNTTTNTAELDASWTPQWDKLVGYWRMNGSGFVSNTPFNAEVGLTNCQANVTNSLGYDQGKLNQSIAFQSTKSVLCNAAQVTSIDNNLTIMGWIKHSGGTVISYQQMMRAINYGVVGWMIQRDISNNQFYIRVDTSAQINALCSFASSDQNWFDGEWHHYVFTLSSGTVRTYMDGKPSRTCTYSHGSGFASNVANVGFYGLTTDALTYHDEAAFFSTVLTPTEVKTIYDRQVATRGGGFTSRVMNSLAANSWSSLQNFTTIPFLKEIPSSTESSSSTDGYLSLSSNFSNNLWGLWRLNESSGTTLTDSSGNNNHLTLSGSYTVGNSGLFNNGMTFTTAGGQGLIAPVTFNPANSYSISAWLRMDGKDISTANRTAVAFQGNTFPSVFVTMNGTTKRMRLAVLSSDGAGYSSSGADSTSTVPSKKWFHVLAMYDASTQTYRIYINGVLEASNSSSVVGFSPANFAIGTVLWNGGLNADKWPGMIDEVGVWTRTLSDAEIKELYRRGANRIKYQVRTCSTSDCSEGSKTPANNYGWQGPDGSVNTYFSELSNTSANNLTASMTVPNNQYFQYRAILESDDANSLCNYGSGATACSPELRSVSIGPVHYSTTNAYSTSSASIGSSFATLSGFTVSRGTSGCTGDRYTLSGNGTNFWYFNGSVWAISNGSYAQASTASQINANIGTLVAAMGVGTLQVRTYLNSDGVTPCEVDNILIEGQKY